MDHQDLVQRIKQAYANKDQLRIKGGDSKKFLGKNLGHLTELDVGSISGVIQYEPSELMIQLRSGTLLQQVVELLDSEDQMLAFEPPTFGGNATIGGLVAAGISGSRRPYAGAVRDFVLGINIITGLGDELSFGGQVMKNVAGYDVSRLMVGSMGCFGVITEVSFKVLPKPRVEETCILEVGMRKAYEIMRGFFSRSSCVSATAYRRNRLYVRFSGSENTVRTEAQGFGGQAGSNDIWREIDDLAVFGKIDNLWRISVAPSNPVCLEGADLIDWGGGQRWLVDPGFDPRAKLGSLSDGHATLIKGARGPARYHPLDRARLDIHLGLKRQFDPGLVLNPNKMYAEF